MNESQSLTNNLLIEVDVLSNRLRNIKNSYKTTENKALKERLFSENKNIFKRVGEIYKIAKILKHNKLYNCYISQTCRTMPFLRHQAKSQNSKLVVK